MKTELMKAELKITFARVAFFAALIAAAYFVAGCSVTKINYEKEDGKVSYRIYRNDHWLKTDASGIKGGMSDDGKFEFSAEGLKSSPSEEFNRTMQTYTSAFVQLAQIAAAAYNPSASAAVTLPASSAATPVTVNVTPTVTTEAEAQPSASQESQASEESQPTQESK